MTYFIYFTSFFQSVIVIPFTALFEVQFFIVGYNYRNGICFLSPVLIFDLFAYFDLATLTNK